MPREPARALLSRGGQPNWWARLGSNQRPADYESQKKPSDTVQLRRSEYKASRYMSNKSAVVRPDRSDWQSRLAVKTGSQTREPFPSAGRPSDELPPIAVPG